MNKILVIGAGMVGQTMALDLAKKHSVRCIDVNTDALRKLSEKNNKITTDVVDATDREWLTEIVKNADLVISAVPGFLGYQVLETIILAKKNVVDISFFPEDPFELHELAQRNNVLAIVDCGVAPGLHNIILGHINLATNLPIESYECYVGGLPKVRNYPFEYKAPFSPVDVIEEYTREARNVIDGKVVTSKALSDVENMDFEKVGTLEAFNSDGLRTLIKTMSHIPNMKEKTLRYCGHTEKIKMLRDAGFFKPEHIKNTCKVLFDNWKLHEDDEDFTVMKIIITSNAGGKMMKQQTLLYDEYDTATKTSSMSRTTGYTATAVANAYLNGFITQTNGIVAPEQLGAICNYVINYLIDRGVKIKHSTF